MWEAVWSDVFPDVFEIMATMSSEIHQNDFPNQAPSPDNFHFIAGGNQSFKKADCFFKLIFFDQMRG